jgi:hypothetical protein
MNLSDLSKNIYVINLKEITDKKIHIENQLNKIDCENYNPLNVIYYETF